MSPLRSHPWWLAFAAVCVVTAASAQEVDAGYYDGSWTARLPCRSGQGTCAARLSIADFAGTVDIGSHATESPEVHARHSAPPGGGDLRPATGAANAIRLERR